MAEETRDEVYAVDEGHHDIPRSEKVLQAFDEVLTSEEFCNKQDEFVDENAHLFTEDGDMAPECMSVYQKYVQLIEDTLLSKVLKIFPDFTFDELIPIIKSRNKESIAHADVFELLSATLNFEDFRELMVSYNKGSNIELGAVITKFD